VIVATYASIGLEHTFDVLSCLARLLDFAVLFETSGSDIDTSSSDRLLLLSSSGCISTLLADS